MNSLLTAIKAFVLKSRPAYKDDLGNGKYDIKKLPEECIPDSVNNKIEIVQSAANKAQSTANKAWSITENKLSGKTWTQSDITSGSFSALYYADGIWVAGSMYKGLYYSTNGKTWTQSNLTSEYFSALYYADGIWVAGSQYNGLYYSTNGKTWTQSDLTSGSFSALYYADGIWVAGERQNGKGLYYSQSKLAFTKTVDTQIAEINQSMNQFQRIGDDVIISSSTPDSTKKFKITVDDTGTISATEVT